MKNGDKAVYDGKMVEVIGFDNKNNLTKIKYGHENNSTLLVPPDLLYVDHRFSDNPEVALRAVMKRHGITFEFGRESDSYSWAYIASTSFGSLASTTDRYSGVISYKDIKEPLSSEI